MKRSVIVLFLVSILLIGFMFVVAQDEGSAESPPADSSESESSPETSSESETSDTSIESPEEKDDRSEDSGERIGGEERERQGEDFGEGEQYREREEFQPNYEQVKDFAEDNNMKDLMEDCPGRFEITEENKFLCIPEEPDGLMSVECPNEQIYCDGETRWIVEDGCNVPVCIKELEGDIGGDESCALRGGEIIEDRCITPFDETEVIDELKPISEKEIDEIFSRLEEFESKLIEFLKKLDGKEGGEFEDARTRLQAVLNNIDSIKTDLLGEITDEKRMEIIPRLNNLRKTTEQILIGIERGERVDDRFLKNRKMEQMEHFGEFTREDLEKMAEKEKTALGYVRECEIYSRDNSKEFVPPDPEGFVVKVKLSGLDSSGKCIMELTFKDGETATYHVLAYRNLNPEKSFFESECSGSCDKMKQMMESHIPQSGEEKCMYDCFQENCPSEQTTFMCMAENSELEKECASRCGMDKGVDKGYERGDMGEEENCIFECVQRKSPGIMCGPSAEGEQGSEVCQECAQECASLYEGPCLNDEQKREKQNECESRCEHCYGEPIIGDSGEGYECIIDIRCEDASDEFGDNPGGPGISGEVVSESEGEGIITKFFNWLKGLFNFSEKSSEVELSKGDSKEDITSDLLGLSAELDAISKDLS